MSDEPKFFTVENPFSTDAIVSKEPSWVWHPKRYECPVHGIIEATIDSHIPGHEGHWCQLCWIDSFERIGVSRVKPVEGSTHSPADGEGR